MSKVLDLSPKLILFFEHATLGHLETNYIPLSYQANGIYDIKDFFMPKEEIILLFR